ncbi:signal recognition particle-docking protein FtsY [Paraglaciecola arctica]|uniref:Signal recognition particle receptor FtsY n=1 Tax=Paraglaciecola arctica BSs20135 TaxID=493475 RepID=K6XEN0_9ALTE|nr:signal recognition particle-docking protein FtsY [Paraglaciecola arctica]GAC19099.1 fused signal recognition particle receptor [Paraglaciecola arctica BSs20135]
MSKFFKWLKKDKQQEESPVVNEVPVQAADEPVSSEAESIKNDSSVTKDLIIKPSEENQPEQAVIASEPEPKVSINKELGANTSVIENNHSYTKTVEEDESRKIPERVEPELKTKEFITDSLIENPPTEKNTSLEENKPSIEILDAPNEDPTIEQQEAETIGFFSKLKRGLSRTKESIGSGIVSLFRGKAIDDELFEELETQLLVADVGMDTTVKIIKQLTESSDRKQLKDGDALYQLLKEQMADILKKVESPLTLKTESGPFVILMVGVNGVGKTTTIGKMAKQFQQQGKKVMLAAGDTFRAAAVEQLQVWGDRNNIPVVAQQTGSDSASVIFDAFQSAKAKNIDVLIADTAGRLQNKDHLMEELKKVVRVMKKIAPDAPHEIMLTLDAGTGQNAVSQTKLFNEAVGLTGLSLTKLDGTAKGGVIFAIADQFNIPIRYVGIGEGIDDLRPFNSQDFVNALFIESDSQQEKTN